ncbi:MAG: hypothetical protein NT062_10320 [Proteobacteria bacterium]|nr:hypothetical protein [Pseudomonadota bacterium]
MKLFATMCNQPQRLAEALDPIRATLVAEPLVSRWGLGYIQGGDVLLVRTPKASERSVDLAGPLLGHPPTVATDCAIAIAVRDVAHAPVLGGTDNTPPFRFRRWLYAQTGLPAWQPEAAAIAAKLLAHVPEYLRRNLRGRTPGELIFHQFLAMLHDEGRIEDPNLPTAVTLRVLASTLRLVNAELAAASLPPLTGTVAMSDGRSMVIAHLPGDLLRLRRLWVLDDRGNRDANFRGVIVVSGRGDGKDGFEDVPVGNAVLVSRDLQVSFADLGV